MFRTALSRRPASSRGWIAGHTLAMEGDTHTPWVHCGSPVLGVPLIRRGGSDDWPRRSRSPQTSSPRRELQCAYLCPLLVSEPRRFQQGPSAPIKSISTARVEKHRDPHPIPILKSLEEGESKTGYLERSGSKLRKEIMCTPGNGRETRLNITTTSMTLVGDKEMIMWNTVSTQRL